MFGGSLARQLGPPPIRLEIAVASGSADEGFVMGSAGLEAAALPRRTVAPIAALRFGLLVEPEYGGWVGSVGAGLRVGLGDSFAIRGIASRGIHGGEVGPHMLAAGVELPVGFGY